MFSLCWSVDELHVEIGCLLLILENPSTDFIGQNIARRLTKVRDTLLPFIRGVSRYQRHPATHVLIVPVRETRNPMLFYPMHIIASLRVGLAVT